MSDEQMADARDAWLKRRAEKEAEEARLLALRLAANKRTIRVEFPMTGTDYHTFGEE